MRSPKDQDLVDFVGHQVRAARETVGYTQQKLAEILGISPQYMSHLENGKYSLPLTLLRDICKALSISPELLIFGEPIQKNDITFFENQIANLNSKYIPGLMESLEADIRLIKSAETKAKEN